LQHARGAAAEARRVLADFVAPPAGFDADQFDCPIGHKRVEHADGVAPAAHAGENGIGQAAFGFQNLAARLLADARMEIAHHHGIRMRAQRGAEQVVRIGHVRYPIAHSLADGVLQCAAAGGDGLDPGAQQTHAEHVQPLAAHILFAHVDHALEPQERADGRGGDAVLTGTGLRNDAPLSHAPRQQRLAERVVDLVRARVQQVLALDPDARAAERFR
jgi:hypothetical protein